MTDGHVLPKDYVETNWVGGSMTMEGGSIKKMGKGGKKGGTDSLKSWRDYVAAHKNERKSGETWKAFIKRLSKSYK
jgi:hypothetical protein